jgi:hypothetical protein
MTATDIAAWVGAVGAVVAIAWDFFKWRFAGARVQLHLAPNMEMLPPSPLAAKGELVIVTAVNVGDAPTTITHVLGVVYQSRLAQFRRKRKKTVVFMPVELGPPVPHVLHPGEQWTCGIIQSQVLDATLPSDVVLLGLQHAVASKPVLHKLHRPSSP